MEGTSRAMLSKQEIDDIETATVGQFYVNHLAPVLPNSL